LICLSEADAGGKVAAVIGAALSGLKAAGVAAAAIGERVGGVVVERSANMEPVVCTSLQKDDVQTHDASYSYKYTGTELYLAVTLALY
jgi:hypothetical protein